VHDRWRSFGFSKLNARAPVFVNVLRNEGGPGYDNAFYSRSVRFRTGIFVFGGGDRFENLGLDGDVYYHEYGHGVLDKTKPGFFEAIENNYPGAFHEAFGDISATAITGNSKLGEFGLRLKSTKRFLGRNLANTNRYPQNVPLPPTRKSEPHHTGLIVGGAWWDLRNSIGAEEAQRILFASLNLVPNELTFFDIRDAMITADQNLNHGSHVQAIIGAFSKHGLNGADPGQPGSITVTGLKTAIVNDANHLVLKTAIQKGEHLYVLANYQGRDLTPGFNLLPMDATLKGPGASSIITFLLVDEVVNGSRTGRSGAIQALVLTSPNTAAGTYTITIQSVLGGTTKATAVKSVKFMVTN
jgi:hypothetical protein